MNALLSKFKSLKPLPLDRLVMKTTSPVEAWHKTHVIKSRLRVDEKFFADAPYFQRLVLHKGSMVYVDGIGRLYYLNNKTKTEIQFGACPYWYYGKKHADMPFANFAGLELLINNGSLVEGMTNPHMIDATYDYAKATKPARIKQDFLALRFDPEGKPYEEENFALWPDKCPAIRDYLRMLELENE